MKNIKYSLYAKLIEMCLCVHKFLRICANKGNLVFSPDGRKKDSDCLRLKYFFILFNLMKI